MVKSRDLSLLCRPFRRNPSWSLTQLPPGTFFPLLLDQVPRAGKEELGSFSSEASSSKSGNTVLGAPAHTSEVQAAGAAFSRKEGGGREGRGPGALVDPALPLGQFYPSMALLKQTATWRRDSPSPPPPS